MPIVRASHLCLPHVEMGRGLEGENLTEPQHRLQDNVQSFRRCFPQVPPRARGGARHSSLDEVSARQYVREPRFSGINRLQVPLALTAYRIAPRTNNRKQFGLMVQGTQYV